MTDDVPADADGASRPSRITVEAFGISDPGLARPANEDAFLIGDLETGRLLPPGEVATVRVDGRGPLFIVCDGMGGAAGGAVASRLAADVVWRELAGARPTDERAVFARQLRRAIRAAHQALLDEAQGKLELRGMGTTISAGAMVGGGALLIAQIGDSRAYLERGGELIQVTRDQSVVSALVHAGRLSEAEARLSEKRSLILQALGAGEDVDVALSLVELRRGDRLVMCTDGLHGPVPDAPIRFALGRTPAVDDACRALLALALQGGAPDNTTVIVARFTGDRLPDATGHPVRFTEFDPRASVDGSVADTSWVARRLAVRAGLRDGTLPPVIPATGQHRAVLPAALGLEPSRPAALGPAEALLARSRRLGLVAWAVAAILVVAVLIALAIA